MERTHVSQILMETSDNDGLTDFYEEAMSGPLITLNPEKRDSDANGIDDLVQLCALDGEDRLRMSIAGELLGENFPAAKDSFSLELLCGAKVALQDEQEKEALSCFETISSLSLGLSSDLQCVQQNSPEDFNFLCEQDGLLKTNNFERYLVYKGESTTAQEKIDNYIEENPGAAQVPERLLGKLQNAEAKWRTAGKSLRLKTLSNMSVATQFLAKRTNLQTDI